MDLLARVYWNAVLGALGGLVGWFLGGILDTHTLASDWQYWLLGGALLGGAVGYFVVSSEAVHDRSLVRFARLASHGLVLGILGGGLGAGAAEFLFRFLAPQTGGGGEALVVLTRGVGGLILGLFVGAGEGVAARSPARLRHGALGGAAGGFLGGCLAVAAAQAPDGLAPMLPGACLAVAAVLAQAVFRRAHVRVLGGRQAGRVYPVQKANTLLGCGAHDDVLLSGDRGVQPKHAIIQREPYNRFILVNNAAAERTRVNDKTVASCRELHDGDDIQLGNTTLRFRTGTGRGQRTANSEHKGRAAFLLPPVPRSLFTGSV
jgi:hypothetical protein